MINFDKFKLNCSNIGTLIGASFKEKPLTENQERELFILNNKKKLTEKQKKRLNFLNVKINNYNPNAISNTIKSELIKIYAYEQYNKIQIVRKSDAIFSWMKGTMVEMESIKLLSELDGVEYVKNEKLYSNKFIKGVPDIIDKKNKKIIDIKSSVDIVSFLNNIDKELDRVYEYQLKGYIELTKSDYGEVCFCLVNAPPDLIKAEIKKENIKNLLYNKDNEYSKKSIDLLNNSMIFDDIPMEKRVIRYKVIKDKESMKLVYNKILSVREWLKAFHEKHMNNG